MALKRQSTHPNTKTLRPNRETGIERSIRLVLESFNIPHKEQAYIGRYRPDFLLHTLNAVIECDGPIHLRAKNIAKDRRKNAYYKRMGFRVFRFTSDQIQHDAMACVNIVLRVCNEPV